MLNKVLEWQIPIWQQLLADVESLPHAMIFAGPEGVGKLDFSLTLAARLLCEKPNVPPSPDNMPCGACNSCVWLASGNHLDFRLVQPEIEGGKEEEGDAPSSLPGKKPQSRSGTIRVEQIRALSDFVFIGSHCHGKRIVILSPAETMNPAAANALLKVLEEPPIGVYFILVTSSLQHLLPTVRSRCRKTIFSRPDPEQARRWLNSEGVKPSEELLHLVGGAPLLARDWAEQGRPEIYRKVIEALSDGSMDPIAMAAKWSALLKSEEQFGLTQLVEALQKWIIDLLLVKAVGQLRYHETWRKQVEGLMNKVSALGLISCYQELLRIRSVVTHPLNTQLVLEDLATRYLRLFASGRS